MPYNITASACVLLTDLTRPIRILGDWGRSHGLSRTQFLKMSLA